jgi:hypothetical protein
MVLAASSSPDNSSLRDMFLASHFGSACKSDGAACSQAVRWQLGSWSACSSSCGGGTASRTTVCIEVSTGGCKRLLDHILQAVKCRSPCMSAVHDREPHMFGASAVHQPHIVSCVLAGTTVVDSQCIAVLGQPPPSLLTRPCNQQPCTAFAWKVSSQSCMDPEVMQAASMLLLSCCICRQRVNMKACMSPLPCCLLPHQLGWCNTQLPTCFHTHVPPPCD